LRKPKKAIACLLITMSSEDLGKLKELLVDPSRQKILLALRRQGLSRKELLKKLNVDDIAFQKQLEAMYGLVEQIAPTESAICNKAAGLIMLTTKGKAALDKVLAYRKEVNHRRGVLIIGGAILGFVSLLPITIIVRVFFYFALNPQQGVEIVVKWVFSVYGLIAAPFIGGLTGFLISKRKKPISPKWIKRLEDFLNQGDPSINV
jgi:hypothetical protein